MIVPSRNEADDLPTALASRLSEGYPDLELVVVDDRSTDETPAVLARVAASDSACGPSGSRSCPSAGLERSTHSRVSVYDSLAEFYRRVEKNAGSLAQRPFVVTLLVLVLGGLVELSPIAAFLTGIFADTSWLAAVGTLAGALGTASTVATLKRNTGRVGPALLWPVGWCLMASGVLRSVWLAKRRGGVIWRETFYPVADLLEGQRFKLL